MNAKNAVFQINETVSSAALIAQGFGDPTKDPTVPNIIVRPNLGTCYHTGTSKTAEHGSLNDDDHKVACIVSNPSLKKTKIIQQVRTKLLRAADRYAYTGCGSTAYCYLFYWGRANTYTQKKTLSVENLSRANSWSLSSCACPAGSCPAGSLSS